MVGRVTLDWNRASSFTKKLTAVWNMKPCSMWKEELALICCTCLMSSSANVHFQSLALPDLPWSLLPEVWRYSFWARRRLVKSLGKAIDLETCPTTARAGKDCLKLVNNAVFFIPSVFERISKLQNTHLMHQRLARSVAYEMETQKVDFDNPPDTKTFQRALFYGHHFPVQACLYIDYRTRLYLLRTLTDYWLAQRRGEFGNPSAGLWITPLSSAMTVALETLSKAKSFRLFPIFWQTFLWSWGGFLLK